MKQVIYKILKTIWAIIGGAILIWTGYWYYQIHIIGDIGGVLVTTIFFGIGLYGLLIFAVLTILFLLIKWVAKKFK